MSALRPPWCRAVSGPARLLLLLLRRRRLLCTHVASSLHAGAAGGGSNKGKGATDKRHVADATDQAARYAARALLMEKIRTFNTGESLTAFRKNTSWLEARLRQLKSQPK